MNEPFVVLIIFMGLTLASSAVFMLVRDLFTRSATSGGGTVAAPRGAFRIGRLPLARDARPPRSMIEGFDQWFSSLVVESGLPWTATTALLLLLLAGTFVGGVLFIWIEAPLAATVGMFAGMGLVLVYMVLTRSRRIALLQDQLPPALDMLARAVHAGESLEQAVQLVGEKSPEPLAIEFRRCAAQLNMGLSMAAVMRALVHRVRLLDVKIFTTTLTVHRQAGGNLAETLERLSSVIRDRLNSRRQLRATTAAGRMSATFLIVLGPAVFAYMFFVQREYISGLMESAVGQSMLVLAIFLEVVGLIWIVRMLRTE